MTNWPEAPVNVTKPLKLSWAFAIAIFTTVAVPTTDRSRTKLPLIVWPAILSSMPSASTRSFCVAGRVSRLTVRPAENDTPGTPRLTSPPRLPKVPVGAIVRSAEMFAICKSPPPIDSAPFSTVRVVVAPSRANETSPESCWPRTSRLSPVPVSRRY